MTRSKSGLALAILTLLCGQSAISSAKAQSPFDGLWSVLILTEQGACDRGYRYAVRIKGGLVRHADPANSAFQISGRVSGSGAINVRVARGSQSANGKGRINRSRATGQWKSAKGECAGSWQAERRGN